MLLNKYQEGAKRAYTKLLAQNQSCPENVETQV